MTAILCVTKHGLRQHYYDPDPIPAEFGVRRLTLCGAPAYAHSDRSRLWRRRLAQASICRICEQEEEQLS